MQSPVEETLSPTPKASACSQVPIDILHEILPYCMPPYPTIRSTTQLISSLSQVSSTWRAAVRSSPQLWCRLLVTLRRNDDLNHCAQMVTQWFEHAPSLSLALFLNIDFVADDDEDIARIRTFLVDLSSVMLRVRRFAFHSKITTKLMCAFVDLEWKLPQLKILDLLSHDRLDHVNPVAFSVPLFHNVPNLDEVAIGNAMTWATDITHILPWSRLTHIRLKYETSISRWIEVMNMCPQMRFCSVHIDDDYYSPPCSPSGIHHGLKRLFLHFSNGETSFVKLLSLYQLPSLFTLCVNYSPELELPFNFFPCPQGISALTNIQHFTFNAGGIKFPRKYITYLAEVLREMVNLEELDLEQTTQKFIPLYRALSFNRPKEAILPKLTALALWVSSVPQASEIKKELEPLLDMLSSRSGKETIPVGFEPLEGFILGVATEGIYERMRELFDPWVGGLPSRLHFSIELNRSTRCNQPDGWTQPISDY